MRFLLLLTVICPFLTQCSVRSMAISEVADLVADGVPAFEQDDDPQLIREALPANMKLLEAMLVSEPNNERLLATLSQMYASYTFGFVEPDLDKSKQPLKVQLKERTNSLYQKGIVYGERALGLAAKSCVEGLQKASELDACLADLSRDDVPALFWYGFNLAAYINRNLDSVAALAQGVNVEKAMARVIALDEPYTFGCAHVLLMAFYGARSPMVGGNPEKAKFHYERAQALNNKQFLLTDVFYARYVMVQNDDQPNFESTLKRVSEHKPAADSDRRLQLYNSLAKSRANLYLGQVDEFF